MLEIVHLESLKRKQSAEGEATGVWGGVTEVSRGAGEEGRKCGEIMRGGMLKEERSRVGGVEMTLVRTLARTR